MTAAQRANLDLGHSVSEPTLKARARSNHPINKGRQTQTLKPQPAEGFVLRKKDEQGERPLDCPFHLKCFRIITKNRYSTLNS